jgi:hypothetical protein
MAYIDSTPERLMPAPIALSREISREMSAAADAQRAPVPTTKRADRRRLETMALIAIAALFVGLVFALAIKAIASLGIALVVTAMTLLPILSLAVAPSKKGR